MSTGTFFLLHYGCSQFEAVFFSRLSIHKKWNLFTRKKIIYSEKWAAFAHKSSNVPIKSAYFSRSRSPTQLVGYYFPFAHPPNSNLIRMRATKVRECEIHHGSMFNYSQRFEWRAIGDKESDNLNYIHMVILST